MDMKKNDKIYIAGHRGLVGSAILRKLKDNGYENLIYKTHSELDLTDQSAVKFFFEKEKPDFVFCVQRNLAVWMRIENLEPNLFMIIYKFKIT